MRQHAGLVVNEGREYVPHAGILARRGEAFNAGGGRPHSVAEVVRRLCEVAGANVEPDIRGVGTPAGEIDRQYLDSTKIREVTGWEPEVELDEGLRRTVAWYREHPEARAPAPA